MQTVAADVLVRRGGAAGAGGRRGISLRHQHTQYGGTILDEFMYLWLKDRGIPTILEACSTQL